MRLHRFYVSQPLGEDVVINDVSIIKQWSKVFRYTIGDFVILFNGNGDDITFSISSLVAKECKLTRVDTASSYIPSKKITLYLSCIKKDNFELVVQKATELGITTIVPIISERSEKKNLNEGRLIKIAIEASEQCSRGDIPSISTIVSLEKALKSLQTTKDTFSFVLQIGGTPIREVSIQEKITSSASGTIFIGPEGGWSPEEESLFTESGITSISLGQTVLRAETAAIVACTFTSL